MPIKIHAQHFELAEPQRSLIHAKAEKMVHLADRLSDPSSQIRVDLIHEHPKSPEEAFVCHLTLIVPHDTLRAESRGPSPEAAMDLAVGKMRGQIERYKAKEHHLNERHN